MKLKFVYAITCSSFVILFILSGTVKAQNKQTKETEYEQLQKKLSTGWNTWDNRSVLTHVLLPEGLAISLKLKDSKSQKYLKEALIGRRGTDVESIQPIAHTYDGSYTELNLQWADLKIKVQSATVGNDQVILVTPIDTNKTDGLLLIEASILWGREGSISKKKDRFGVKFPGRWLQVFVNGPISSDTNPCQPNASDIAVSLSMQTGISSGKNRDIKEVKAVILAAKLKNSQKIASFGETKETYDAIQSVLAWNVIYDPSHQRVITPVSRIWNYDRGGYVLFCWDTYFASYMLSLGSKELAYANAVEVTKAVDILGFVPNVNAGNELSADRSQPPVGSMIIKAIYNKYHEKWFLNEVFDRLLTWNRWWPKNRDMDGYLCWGSTPLKGQESSRSEKQAKQFAMWESGLDNSPMYDEAKFDLKKNLLPLADVGLISMYIADCEALIYIAKELNRPSEIKELYKRIEKYKKGLSSLWDEKTGIYRNKLLDAKLLSKSLSPTNFYPLLTNIPTKKQAERMIKEHFYDKNEFWGDYIMPSIARNDD